MNRSHALIVGLLLLTVPLAGCVDQPTGQNDTADDGTDQPDGDEPADAPTPKACSSKPESGLSLPSAPSGGLGLPSNEPGLDVSVRQEEGKTVYWVKPGPRELSPYVFGTEDNPRMTGDWQREAAKGPIKDLLEEVPFLVGAPEELRKTKSDGTQVLTAPTLFSDKAAITSGALDVTYKDRQPYDLPGPPGKTDDSAKLSTWFTDPDGNEYQIEIDHIVQPPIPGYKTQGGVMTNAWHHGQTGTGSPLMPQVYTYGAFWAIVDVSINGELVNDNFVGHFMTTQNVRTADYELALDEQLPLAKNNTPTGQEHHTHGVVFPINATSQGPVHEPLRTCLELKNGKTQPFIHVMFEEDEILEGPFTDDGPQGLEATVQQEPDKALDETEKTAYWVLPGKRRLSPQVFGTEDNPRKTGTAQLKAVSGPHADQIRTFIKNTWPTVGAPEKARKTMEDGTQVFQPKTLFSDNAAIVNGTFEVTYDDNHPWDQPKPPAKTDDKVDLTTRFEDPAGNEYKIEVKTTVKPPLPGYETGDGVLINARHHGQTGTGSPLMPNSYTYGAFWGIGDLFVRNDTTNGEWTKVDENKVTHFMTTETVRDKDYRIALDEELPLARSNTPQGVIHHTHGVMFPISATPAGPVHEALNTSFVLPNGQKQPFIHMMWENETLADHPFKNWDRRTLPSQGAGGDGGSAGDIDREITIQGNLDGFSKDTLTVSQGDTVKVTFENTGSSAHNFGVDFDGDDETEDDARTETIQAGETASVTFTADESGDFFYFCDIPGHRGSGMEGTLTVK